MTAVMQEMMALLKSGTVTMGITASQKPCSIEVDCNDYTVGLSALYL